MDLRGNGAILLISCYELGHQPYGVAHPSGYLNRAGYSPAALDIAVEGWDVAAVQAARFIGISVPLHTGVRVGLKVIQRYVPPVQRRPGRPNAVATPNRPRVLFANKKRKNTPPPAPKPPTPPKLPRL